MDQRELDAIEAKLTGDYDQKLEAATNLIIANVLKNGPDYMRKLANEIGDYAENEATKEIGALARLGLFAVSQSVKSKFDNSRRLS